MTLQVMNYLLKYLLAAGILGSLTTSGFTQGEDVGRTEYDSTCASCHGRSGNGDGPVGEALRTRPSDLTLLAKSNGGVFPAEVLYQIIDGRRTLRAHGNYEMPVWGGRISRERILAITAYLKSLQVK
jgi:mono/diheme cytochrome c family protein